MTSRSCVSCPYRLKSCVDPLVLGKCCLICFERIKERLKQHEMESVLS